MAENRRERDKRFYFTRKQIVMLGVGFTLASAAIFFLGIFVGKSIEARRMSNAEQPLIKVPVKPASEPSGATAAPSKDEQPVYESITKPALAQTINEETSKDLPVIEDNKTPATGAAKPTEKTADKVSEDDSAKKMSATDANSAKDGSKNWRVQVNAYPDEQSAKQLVDRLKNKSYNAYVTEARQKGKTWYRVNVGKYNSREEADKVLERLKAKENLTNAFATSRE